MLSLTFGVLALVLSSVGLFAYKSAVSRRKKELGIRLALARRHRS